MILTALRPSGLTRQGHAKKLQCLNAEECAGWVGDY